MELKRFFDITAIVLYLAGCIATVLSGIWVMTFLWWLAIESMEGPTYPGVIITTGPNFWWVVLFIPCVGLYFYKPVRKMANDLL